jgi:hypothetical protein
MCGGAEAPEAPDPYATAEAQYLYEVKAAKEAAKLNAIDQFGPMGSTTYQRGADGTPTSQTVNLSPQVKAWLDSQFGSATKLQDATSKQLDYLPQDKYALPGGKSADQYAREAFGDEMLDPSRMSDTSEIARASYDSQKAMFAPDIDAARKQTEIRLAERGISPGDEIWRDEMDRIDRQANAAYEGASRSATLDAGNEQTRRVNAATQARNYGSNSYQTDVSNELLERNQPFAEAGALMGTTPQFQTPSFMNTGQQDVKAPDYQGAVNANYNARMGQYNANQTQKQNMMGSIAGLAGSAIQMFSDEDLKEDREAADGEAILAAFRGMPVDDYRYKEGAREAFDLPEKRTGTMAQDYAEEFGGDGHMIDVGDAVGKLMAAVKALDARTSSAGRRV